MSRQDPHINVTLFAWRIAQVSFIIVVSLTVLIALAIGQHGEEVQAALKSDHFDERWQIRSGVAQLDRLVLHPTADTISTALRPLSAASGFTVQTRVTFNQPQGTAGLIVQADAADHFTAFIISADGYFRLSDYRNGAWIDRVSWRAWPHIQRDTSSNVLRAECRDEGCTFFVNDEWTWQADSIPTTTQIGVLAALSEANYDAQMTFDQFALSGP